MTNTHDTHMGMLRVVDERELFTASRAVCGTFVLYLGQLRTATSSLSYDFKTRMHLSLCWIIRLATLSATEEQ